ncbi:MAG: penicillin-binding protein activator [Deltaproteobacteria bacterium]|nr:penicillin-binding protein activator [Deltaproteobacteria bacterium]
MTIRRALITIAIIAAYAVIMPSTAARAGLFGPSTEELANELNSILEAVESGGATEANIAKLEKYIRSNPKGEFTDEALIEIAVIYTEQKDFFKASLAYKTLIERFPGSKYKTDSIYGLGLSEYRKGNLKEARAVLESFLQVKEAKIQQKVKANHLLKTISSVEAAVDDKAEQPSVAAILPLSGKYSTYGEKALRGILLAAGIYGKTGAPEAVSYDVKVFDTETGTAQNPNYVAETVASVAKNTSVTGIVGPLLSRDAEPMAIAANKASIPALILSQKEGITKHGPYVLRNFITPAAQTSALAEHATTALGKKTFVILYPDTPLGKEMATSFTKEINARGANIVAQTAYLPDTKDFSDILLALFKIKTETKLEGRRRISEFTAGVKADAIFIPDGYEAIAQIAPFLAYYNLKKIQMLGTNGWNSEELIKLSGQYVEGAVIVDGYFAESQRKGATDFATLFETAYGYKPGIIEAEAYDSTLALTRAATAGPEREKILKAILSSASVEGSAGTIRFDKNGESIKEMFILKIKDGKITEASKSAKKTP